MFYIYRSVLNLIIIFSPIIIILRILRGKEDPSRFKEKFCFFSKKRLKGKLIWFHGASVGEILSIIPVIEKLEKNNKIKQILLTSNTLSSSKIISNLKLKKTVHQFFPVDTNYHTEKFINYWDPSIAIFVDSEIWPNMLTNVKKKSISLMLLNARITKKSFKRWSFFISTARKIFQKFDICLSASKESKKYLKFLGVKNVKYIGNLKFSQTENTKNFLNKKLKKFFLSKKVWCAASTHRTEEQLCAKTHKRLKKKYKNILTVIIPRHINRAKSIISEMDRLNLRVHSHESKTKINKNTDIYLVDSYGQTKSFFKICKTVFLGGSMIGHGGQNPLEAARYGCKILHGPNVWNFQEIYKMLNKFKVSNKVHNLNEITSNVNKQLKNKNNSKDISSKIKNLGNKILNLTVKEVKFLIDKK